MSMSEIKIKVKLSIFGVLLIEFDSVAGCEHVGEYKMKY